jgi:Zn-dependent protease
MRVGPIFAEPPTTRFDLRFTLARIPVRIHPFFWLSTLGLTLRSNIGAMEIAIWVGGVLLSILVHELGHALAFRSFGCRPRITLYGFGGLASAESGTSGAPAGFSRVIVSAAGPFSGFALAGVVVAALLAAGRQVPVMSWTLGSGLPIRSDALFVLVADLMLINVLWGLLNLLPVHPLDGGDIALELARKRDPRRGVERSVWLSFYTALAVAIAGIVVWHDLFVLLLFGYLAAMSWRVLRTRHGAGAHSFRVVRWIRARRKRNRAKTTLRRLDEIDDATPSPEVDNVVRGLFDRVAKERESSRRSRWSR